MTVEAAVVLAGGAGRRLGGVDKPSLTKDGVSLLDRVLSAVGDVPTVLVGPPRTLPPHCRQVREDPPGSGPAAAVAAALPVLADLPGNAVVALLAADLPAVDAAVLHRLVEMLVAGAADGAVLLDPSGRRQHLLGVWRLQALRTAAGQRPSWSQAALRSLLAPLSVVEVRAHGDEATDIDTPDDLRRWRASGEV